ncbi:MAG: RNA 2',3'-cyclic phosphodiesterase [Deltaproteobacteria bacterium]|nr:MAG: RNA 2',3'-cyclic phosphodiesterase [Deltaproteobacteria bacterium]
MTENHRETIRAFIAVHLPGKLLDRVAELRAALEPHQGRARIKWVRPGNMHITLKFLGEIATASVEPLGRALRKELGAVRPFDIELAGCGSFPPRGRPRVLWVGVREGAERLKELAERVEDACAGLGFARESRPFRAHLTLARVKDSRGIERLTRAMEQQAGFVAGRCRCDVVYLIKSELRPEGPRYTVLDTVALEG